MHRLLASATIMFFLFFASVSAAQDGAGMKMLTIEDNPVLESPVSLDVYLHGKKIKSGVPFRADDNWIEDLQIWATNKTDEEIQFLSLVLDFPTEHNGEPMMKRYRINFGKDQMGKLEADPDVEAKKIDKKGAALVTISSNNPGAGEQFRQLKKSSLYDPKIWDRGVLFVYAVGFETRSWLMGADFDKQSDGTWKKNKEKEQRLKERIRKARQEQQSKIGLLKSSFLTPKKAATTCYTWSDPVGDNFPCTAAAQCPVSFCSYFKPFLETTATGWTRYLTSPVCKQGQTDCGCCQPNVYDLSTFDCITR